VTIGTTDSGLRTSLQRTGWGGGELISGFEVPRNDLDCTRCFDSVLDATLRVPTPPNHPG